VSINQSDTEYQILVIRKKELRMKKVFLFGHPFPFDFAQGRSTHTEISPDDVSGKNNVSRFGGK
jgi:hypothetical protein